MTYKRKLSKRNTVIDSSLANNNNNTLELKCQLRDNGVTRAENADNCRDTGMIPESFLRDNLNLSRSEAENLIDSCSGQLNTKTLNKKHEIEVSNYYDFISEPLAEPKLKPLYFEVPQTSQLNLVGRNWVFDQILNSEKHILIEGRNYLFKSIDEIKKSILTFFQKKEKLYLMLFNSFKCMINNF